MWVILEPRCFFASGRDGTAFFVAKRYQVPGYLIYRSSINIIVYTLAFSHGVGVFREIRYVAVFLPRNCAEGLTALMRRNRGGSSFSTVGCVSNTTHVKGIMFFFRASNPFRSTRYIFKKTEHFFTGTITSRGYITVLPQNGGCFVQTP